MLKMKKMNGLKILALVLLSLSKFETMFGMKKDEIEDIFNDDYVNENYYLIDDFGNKITLDNGDDIKFKINNEEIGLEEFNMNEKILKIKENGVEKILAYEQSPFLCIDNAIHVGALQNKIVLMEKSSSIIDKIKESFSKDGLSETQIIELYSNVDMLIIDEFGNENLSKWALEKLYKIISNRYDNELPIVITTRYNKEQLIEQLSTENNTEIAEEIVEVLNEMCYGISIVEEIKAKEKVSISDQTIC